MVVKHCCYGTCSNDSRYLDREGMEGVFFIPFPKPKTKLEQCLKWISLCGRPHKDFNVDKIHDYTYICSKHFVGGSGPTDSYPDPVPAIQVGSSPSVPKKSRKARTRNNAQPIQLIEHNYFATQTPSACMEVEVGFDEVVDEACQEVDMDISAEDVVDLPIQVDQITQVGHFSTCEVGIQSVPTMTDASTQTDEECESWMKRKLIMDKVTLNDKSCMFWTGVISLATLNFIFEWVSPCAAKMKLWVGKKRHDDKACKPRKRILSLFEEFVFVLIRIRRGLDTEVLATFMGVTQSHVSKICISWINLLHKCFIPLLEWPTADMVRLDMPKSFRKNFPSTRVIIDCSELFVQTPRALHAQRTTWSSYKSHNTFKFLLGIAPSGQITFLSKLFCGSKICKIH